MDDLLRVDNLQVTFSTRAGPVHALAGLSLRVRPGETVALVGESGSGKSTVAQAVMGLLPPNGGVTGGSVLFADPVRPDKAPLDLATLNPDSRTFRSLRGGRISMIFQDPMTSLSPLHTIGFQVGEALRLHSTVTAAEERARVEEMFAMVGFPDPAKAYTLYPFELSGGLRQRAMIAMALICRPALLIADEPTTALDVTVQAQILLLMRRLSEELGMAMLLITHDLGVVANMADTVAVVHHGRLMERGTARDLFTAPRHPYLKALFGAVPTLDDPVERRLTPLREIPLTNSALIQQTADPAKAAMAAAAGAPPLLELKDLWKTFEARHGGGLFGGAKPRHPAVQGISLRLPRGGAVGVVGESGSGKTTVARLAMRLLDPDSGQVLFHDGQRQVDLTALSTKQMRLYRRRIQYVFQDPTSSLDPRMTVFGLLTEPLDVQNDGDRDSRRALAKELMRVVGLDPHWLGRYPHSFSGGQRQRIGIARALALKPELLLLDEPVSALDVSVQAQILNLLRDLQGGLGLSYLFVSHNLAVVRYLCDTIAVMCAGRVVEYGPAEALFHDARHPYTQALLAAVPHTRLDRPLDFQAIADGRASTPDQWPAPYRLPAGAPARFEDVGDGHLVLLPADSDGRRAA